MSVANPTTIGTFPCSQCGANLEFKPGTRELVCPHCGAMTPIPDADTPIDEIDFRATLDSISKSQDVEDKIVVRCESCGASVEMEANVTGQSCPFCGANIVATGESKRLIKPKAVLPFGIPADQARAKFAQWLHKLWFAPSQLRRLASVEGVRMAGGSTSRGASATGLTGVYLPYWTFDAKVDTDYTGQRGDNYVVMVPVTRTVNGRSVTTMVAQTRVRWSFASGQVHNDFDDIVIPGARTLAPERLRDLGSWDLSSLEPYDDRYLAGFRTESYSVALEPAFEEAKNAMLEAIRATVRRDIGGDHQRIDSMHPTFNAITFKHVLFPVWVSTYRYHGKLYTFLVNARTGAVTGERPYSAWKITLAVLAALAAIGVIVLLANR